MDYANTLHLFARNADKHREFQGKGEGVKGICAYSILLNFSKF